jgi:hypothetical protein
MSVYDTEETRRRARVEDSFPLKLTVRAPHSLRMQLGPEIDAVAGDIGTGGVGMYSNAEMPSDAILDLTFKISGDSTAGNSGKDRYFDLSGRVSYSVRMPDGGCRLGVSFLNISDDDVAFIRNYVGSRTVKLF